MYALALQVPCGAVPAVFCAGPKIKVNNLSVDLSVDF
jgi:hypothetical protein